MPRIIVDESVCKGCGLCADACPKKLISLDTGRLNPKGYHPARLMEPEKCVGCAACAAMCPDTAITVEK
jgi:2-oxoglutarate ferredoxin oxidoreductase subunit delta